MPKIKKKKNINNIKVLEMRCCRSYHERRKVFVTEAFNAREHNRNKKFRKKGILVM